ASDSGSSNSDNLTAVTSPTFSVAGVEAGATVQLVRDGVVVASVFSAAGGTVMFQDSTLADGIYVYTALATDRAGNVSALSGELMVTIDATAPAAPSAPDLESASDVGLSDTDNVTSIISLTFDVTGVEAGATV